MTAYAIKGPNGVLFSETIRQTRKDCKEEWLKDSILTWKTHYKVGGYRCVKVEIKEVKK